MHALRHRLALQGMHFKNGELQEMKLRLAAGLLVQGPEVGAIAVMNRGKSGGHVGVVSGLDEDGDPIIISGNYSRRVAEAVYARSRIVAYVLPDI